MTKDEPRSKVLFRVVSEDGSVDVETLWAFDLGDDTYRLDNSPFYAYSVSWEDIVLAPYSEEEQFPTFDRVIKKSGNRTIRVIFDTPVEEGNRSDRILQDLVERGCSYEGASPTYLAVNIPKDVELDKIRSYLIESEVEWEHADPSYDELYSAMH